MQGNHYFTNDPNLKHDIESFEIEKFGKSFTFLTDAGVFSKGRLDKGSELLIESVPTLLGKCADMGCGYGPIGIMLAVKNEESEFILADINERAVGLANENIKNNSVKNAKAVVSNGLWDIDGGLSYVISNPPIRIGKQAMYDLFRSAYEKLNMGGEFYIVIRKQQGAPSAKEFLKELFGEAETVNRGAGYHIIRSIKIK
ncbi:MAG: class I SAM-dependent methyltransferase [Clostridia bacterium]|nr:class I SAM-dependent methyltransferase [Clostridia bacterium]